LPLLSVSLFGIVRPDEWGRRLQSIRIGVGNQATPVRPAAARDYPVRGAWEKPIFPLWAVYEKSNMLSAFLQTFRMGAL
jgi:hypothetical protein